MTGTPGPWSVDPDPPKYARIRSATRWIVAMVGNNENAEPQTKADAELIAAAPLLADALATCRSELLNHTRSELGDKNGSVIDAIEEAEAALRAAGWLIPSLAGAVSAAPRLNAGSMSGRPALVRCEERCPWGGNFAPPPLDGPRPFTPSQCTLDAGHVGPHKGATNEVWST